MTSDKKIPAIILTAQESYTPDPRVTAYISKSRVTEEHIVQTVLGALEGKAVDLRCELTREFAQEGAAIILNANAGTLGASRRKRTRRDRQCWFPRD